MCGNWLAFACTGSDSPPCAPYHQQYGQRFVERSVGCHVYTSTVLDCCILLLWHYDRCWFAGDRVQLKVKTQTCPA